MNLGLLIISITALGYIANWINWRFLNYKLVRLLYFIGAFIHETSHTIACLLTGARIAEFNIFSSQPHITYNEPRLKFLGKLLISLAPIIGGLAFLFLINKFLLTGYFKTAEIANLKDVFEYPFALISQMNLIHWQSWIMILLFLNVGAMIGPSAKDLKNIWLILIIFFFIKSTALDSLIFLTLGLIFTNILIQIILIPIILFIRILKKQGN